mmetsp:Transcript_54600/g.145864  ORF Transcript_54600/g.145864 Transcript_54600/m.145864 type:complete len:94 (-) Transcript_54600:4652-4933(-)
MHPFRGAGGNRCGQAVSLNSKHLGARHASGSQASAALSSHEANPYKSAVLRMLWREKNCASKNAAQQRENTCVDTLSWHSARCSRTQKKKKPN